MKEFTMHGLLNIFIFIKLASLLGNEIDYNFQIEEECPIGYFIGNLKSPHQEYATISQRIFETNKKIDSLFSLDSKTGDLRTNSRIDRESVCPNESIDCSLRLTILQVTENNLEHWLTVGIVIKDKNDNKATFSLILDKLKNGFYEINVDENNIPFSEYILPKAIDLDTKNYGIITYQLEDYEDNIESEKKNFDIQIRNDFQPILIARQSFDYEMKKEIKLSLIAVEENSQPHNKTTSARLDIRFKITDVNDNAPIFYLPVMNFDRSFDLTIEENTPVNSIILTCRARDADSGENGRVKYKFIDDFNDSLRINEDTGEISLANDIKAHVNSNLQYKIMAYDQGVEKLNSTFLLRVYIADQNDHSPVITVKPTGRLPKNYEQNQVFVKERSIQINEGVNLALIFIEDLDVGPNGEVNCSLASQTVYLSEKGISAKLQLTKTGMFSSKTLYKLKIIHFFTSPWESREEKTIQLTCHDNGKPSKLTNSINLNLRIIREEDFELKFEKEEYIREVYESADRIAEIFKISIVDSDGQIEYHFDDSVNNTNTQCSGLVLDPMTGLISAPNGIDREIQDTIICRVKAIEYGSSLSKVTFANVVIKILDVNDNRPKLSKSLKYYGLNITEYNKEQVEIISQSVMDGLPLGKATCEDRDVGKNGLISYSLISVVPIFSNLSYYKNDAINLNDYNSLDFSIDKASGELFLPRVKYDKIDRELVTSFKVTIQCQDSNETSPLFSEETFLLNIINVDDCHPIWLEYFGDQVAAPYDRKLEIYLPTEIKMENNSDMYQTINLKATDPDLNKNSKVTFYTSTKSHSFRPNDPKLIMLSHGSFTITKEGQLRINKIHLKVDTAYGILITANDNNLVNAEKSDALIVLRMVSTKNMIFADDPNHNFVDSKGHIIFKPYLQPFLVSKQVGLVFGISLMIVFLCLLLSVIFIVFYVKRRHKKTYFGIWTKNRGNHHNSNDNNNKRTISTHLNINENFYEQNKTLNEFLSTNKSMLGSSPIASTDITYHHEDKTSNSLNNHSSENNGDFCEINYDQMNNTNNNSNYETNSSRRMNSKYYHQSQMIYDQHRFGSFTPSPIINGDYRRNNEELYNSFNLFYSPKLPQKSFAHTITGSQHQQLLNQNQQNPLYSHLPHSSQISHQNLSIIQNQNNPIVGTPNASLVSTKQFIPNSQNISYNADLFQERKFNQFGAESIPITDFNQMKKIGSPAINNESNSSLYQPNCCMSRSNPSDPYIHSPMLQRINDLGKFTGIMSNQQSHKV